MNISIKKRSSFLFVLFVFCYASFYAGAATIKSRQSGNWTTASTWIYYNSGILSFSNGSNLVTGTGTFFTSELSIGDVIMLQSDAGTELGTVLLITDNTSLVLATAASSTGSGAYGKQKAPVSAAGDDISIESNTTVTTDFSVDFTLENLTVKSNAILTHAANKKIKINASLAIDGTINGASNRDVELNWAGNTGAVLSGTGNFSLSAADLLLKNNITIPSITNLTFNNNGRFNLNGKTATNDGRINLLAPSTFGGLGTFVNNNSSSYLKYSALDDFPMNLDATASGNTVEYAFASGSYKMANSTHHHLIISGGGTAETSNVTFTINGDLTIENNSTLDADVNTHDIVIYGNWDNDNGGSFTEDITKTVTFAGTSNNQAINTPAGGETFGNLTISNTYSGAAVTSAGNIYISNTKTLTISSGIFDLGTYTLDDASGTANLTMTGGNLRLQKLSVVLPELSGTYTLSAGTITFNGAGSQTVRCETVSSPAISDYYHVAFSGSGVKILEGNLDVNGDLLISGSARLEVSSSNNSSNIRNINLAGNWNNTSSDSDPFMERTGTVTFDGANDVSLTASPVSGGETFYKLVVNKSSASDDLTLSHNLTLSNELTLTLGKIITAASNKYLIMDVSATVSVASDNSYVEGPMKKNTNSTVEFRFPVGKSGYYRWIGITPISTNSTTFTAEYFYSAPTSNTIIGAGIDHTSDIEYWTLDRTGASPADADVQLSWNSNSVISNNTIDILVTQWDGSAWTNRCGTCSLGSGSTTTSGSLKASGISTFNNPFTLGSPNLNNDLGVSRYLVGNGNWSNSAIWSNRSASISGASVPGATNRVVIEGGFRVDIDANVSCLKLTVGNNGSGIIDFNGTTNDIDAGSEGIVINTNGDVEGTNAGAELKTNGDILLNADISLESAGGNSSFVLRRYSTGGKTISGTGTVDNLDVDVSTTNSGTITVNSIFQGAGVLTNTGTLIYKGTNANFSAAAFDASSAGNTVHFNNTNANFDIREEATYHHLILSGSSTKICVSDITINGNLTINNGVTLNMDNDDREMIIKGNFINAGVFTPSTSATKEVTFSGTTEQNITSGGSCFYRLFINNSSSTGVVFQDASCIQTGGQIDLSDGYLFLGNNNLVLQGTPTSPSSASSSSFIVTNGTGTVSATCGNITFPVGTAGSTSAYTPLVLNNSGVSDTYSVRICDNVTETGSCSGTAATGGLINKTWQITESVAGGSNVNLSLQWNVSNENELFDRNDCSVSHHNGSNWEALTSGGAASGSGPYSLSASGVSSFSPFTVSSGGAALPVELVYFDLDLIETKQVKISWITASEINNDYYTIERSRDGINFEIVDLVKGAGNSNATLAYNYIDLDPFEGKSYYRLKQTDFDGKYSYSEIKAVELAHLKMEVNLFPNPTDGKFNLVFDNIDEENVILKIYCLSGREMYSSELSGLNRGSFVPVDPGQLPAGVYIVKAMSSSSIIYNKVVIKSNY